MCERSLHTKSAQIAVQMRLKNKLSVLSVTNWRRCRCMEVKPVWCEILHVIAAAQLLATLDCSCVAKQPKRKVGQDHANVAGLPGWLPCIEVQILFVDGVRASFVQCTISTTGNHSCWQAAIGQQIPSIAFRSRTQNRDLFCVPSRGSNSTISYLD